MELSNLIAKIQSKDEAGSLQILETLDPDECNLNERISETTALVEATLLGNANIVKGLIDAGADINAGSDHAVTPLCVAAAMDNVIIARLLLKYGADISRLVDERPLYHIATPLHYAIENRSVAMASLLLSQGHNPNCPSHIYKYPLMESIKYNCPGIARLLVQQKGCLLDCRMNKAGGWSFPPLYQAIFRYRRLEIAQILLETENCKLTFQSDSYICIQMWRIRDSVYDHSRLSSMLLEAGADMDSKDRMGHRVIKSYISGNKIVDLSLGMRMVRKLILAGITPTPEEVEMARDCAVQAEEFVFCDWMQGLATTPRSLFDITRRYIRVYFGIYPNKKLDKLPLPPYLLNILTLRNLRGA